jgi:hypothetical protein
MGYIKSGKDQGANCVLGGNKWGDKGYYIGNNLFKLIKKNYFYYKKFYSFNFLS